MCVSECLAWRQRLLLPHPVRMRCHHVLSTAPAWGDFAGVAYSPQETGFGYTNKRTLFFFFSPCKLFPKQHINVFHLRFTLILDDHVSKSFPMHLSKAGVCRQSLEKSLFSLLFVSLLQIKHLHFGPYPCFYSGNF